MLWIIALALFLAGVCNFAIGMLMVAFHLFDLEFCRQKDRDPVCLEKKEIGPLSWLEGVLMGFAAAIAIAAFLGFKNNSISIIAIVILGILLTMVMKKLIIQLHGIVIRIFFSDFKFI